MNPKDGKDFETRIRERAYQLWIERGQPEGRADDHWDEAARLVEEESASAVGLQQQDVIGAGPETDAAVVAGRRAKSGGRKR